MTKKDILNRMSRKLGNMHMEAIATGDTNTALNINELLALLSIIRQLDDYPTPNEEQFSKGDR